ncbi:unnamed protein product [Ilex paraguariensis]|uniref:Leucine-rich repeat-containing N-terminal plant-type domain-containing protein n=1 Tax=Ilex paraguariensis TaxID=185542 RepID=A0ABC8RBQ8_9AQUA
MAPRNIEQLVSVDLSHENFGPKVRPNKECDGYTAEALLAFKQSSSRLNPNGFLNHRDHSGSSHSCPWQCVTCSFNDGDVTALDLSNGGLVDRLQMDDLKNMKKSSAAEALLAFKQSSSRLNPNGFLNHRDHSGSSHSCPWQCVTCSFNDGDVTALDLSNGGLVDRLQMDDLKNMKKSSAVQQIPHN